MAVLVYLLCSVHCVPAALAQLPDERFRIDIPAGNLADALDTLGDESGMQIMYEPRLVNGIRVAALRGRLTVRDALAQLLVHTRIKVDRVNEKTVVLRAVAGGNAAPPTRQQADSTLSTA